MIDAKFNCFKPLNELLDIVFSAQRESQKPRYDYLVASGPSKSNFNI